MTSVGEGQGQACGEGQGQACDVSGGGAGPGM